MQKLNNILYIFCIFIILERRTLAENRNEYFKKREAVMRSEGDRRTGGSIVLTPAERGANDVLMAAKRREMGPMGIVDGTVEPFPPSVNFFQAKSLIDKSKVFHMIKKMPKGSVLHLHDSSMASIVWLIKRATYDQHCYMCNSTDGKLVFHFYKNPPKNNKGCQWEQVISARKKFQNATRFDNLLHQHLSLITSDPSRAYPTETDVWNKFSSIFTSLSGLLYYEPVFGDYMMEALQEFYDDGVQYMEIRCLLGELYDLNGKVTSGKDFIKNYQVLIRKFSEKHSDFMGAKIIISSTRTSNLTTIKQEVKQAIDLMKEFPGFVVGYDLVGREDSGQPLIYYLDALLYPSQNGIKLPYFFHAGETDWEGRTVDENLIDALLLNTSRIGHGFAITKHPIAMNMAQKQDVPIEVNPISNQVLKLVSDLRDHPAAALLAQGRPLVISADDPGLWGATGVSYDFYETFMAIGGASADLGTLKKLAMDSIKYSAMDGKEKTLTLKTWSKKWDVWVAWLTKQGL